MAMKKISEFPTSTPASTDKILFEKDGRGRCTTIGDAVNTCALSYEEIMATNPEPDLSGKIASAAALNNLKSRITTGFFRVHVVKGLTFVTKDKIDAGGTLPPGTITFFTIIGSSLSNETFNEIKYDGSDIVVNSTFDQYITVCWVHVNIEPK